MASAWNRGGALPRTYEISWGFFRQKKSIARHYIGAFKHDVLYIEGPITLLAKGIGCKFEVTNISRNQGKR